MKLNFNFSEILLKCIVDLSITIVMLNKKIIKVIKKFSIFYTIYIVPIYFQHEDNIFNIEGKKI